MEWLRFEENVEDCVRKAVLSTSEDRKITTVELDHFTSGTIAHPYYYVKINQLLLLS